MKIKFWGTRGSVPVPGEETTVYGGNTTCLEIILENGNTVIIDAGTGIRLLGDKLLKEKRHKNLYLFITHTHWDHLLGFPFFDPLYYSSTRIFVDGSDNCMRGLKFTFDNKMGDGFFPVKFDDLKAEISFLNKISRESLKIGETVIDSIPLHHPQGGIGFRFREGNKTFVFITDNELKGAPWEGRTPDVYAEFSCKADILVHDCQYTPDEIDKRKGWGHSDYEAVVNLAHEADVKKLILFHHDPSRTDLQIKEIENICNKMTENSESTIDINAAREGTELIL